ncbi:PQQ-binding-like beta-propeller repeat protein [Streptomyces sp. NPDC051243]|uniref:nSTAND1 domain-containing NTPase n=1 Tax=Streptomyces sp. NPDC051243 TaxID=3365646 RepID=UPI0037A4DF46
MPAAATSVLDLARCLINRCGVRQEGLSTLVDPPSPKVLGDAVWRAAEEAEDVFFFHYVGHGVCSPGGELHLATQATRDLRQGRAADQALAFSEINDALAAKCRARTIVVVLDCCFSGRARPLPSGDSLLLTSATRTSFALAPDSRRTLFTGEFIRLLDEGDAHGPPRLTLGRVTDVLDRRLTQAHQPPIVRYEGGAGRLVLAMNHGYVPPGPRPMRAQDATVEETSPYLGLHAYGRTDADWFFGRDELAEKLLRSACAQLSRLSPLIVTGASGVGKSSLLQAGLLPRIARVGLGVDRSAGWPHVVFTPGDDPLSALAESLARYSSEEAETTRSLLVGDRPEEALDGLSERHAVVVVDQFEELFALGSAEGMRGAFLRTLAALAGSGRALVVIAVRSDFYGICTDHPWLASGATEFVRPMTYDQLRSLITRPAETAGLVVEPELTEVVLSDLNAHASSRRRSAVLPLLSHALLSTWQRHSGRRLTVADYLATGRVDGAIAATAEDVFARLDAAGQGEARRILVELVNVADDIPEDTRRVVDRTALALDGPAVAALDALVRARLVTVGRETSSDRDTVQISHEALLEAWPRLASWIEEDRHDLLVRQRLQRNAGEWAASAPRDDSLLYEGSRLDEVENLAERVRLTHQEEAFLAAARRRTRRRTRRLLQVIAALSALLLLSGALTVYAFRQRSAAVAERRLATGQKLAVQAEAIDHQPLSLLLSLESLRLAPSDQARAVLLRGILDPQRNTVELIGHNAPVHAVAFSPDGKTLVSAGDDHTIRRWSMTTSAPLGPPIEGHTDPIEALAVSPNGRVIVSGGDDTTVRRWDVNTGKPIGQPLRRHTDNVKSVAISPDGRMIISAGMDRTIQRWNAATGAPIGRSLVGHTDSVWSVAFGQDGKTIFSGSYDGTLLRWDARTGKPIGPPLRGHVGPVVDVAVNTHRSLLVSAGQDGTVRRWDPVTGAPLGKPLTGHKLRVEAVAVAPDGKTIISAGRDRTVRFWSAATGKPQGRPMVGHRDQVRSIAVTKDGAAIATAGRDYAVRLWEKTPGPPVGPALRGVGDQFVRIALAPDGRTIVSGHSDGSMRRWDATSGSPIGQPLKGHRKQVRSIVFSPDGRTIFSAGQDAVVRRWDAATGKPVGKPLTGHDEEIDMIALSPDGTMLASAGWDDTVRRWDATTGAPVGRPLTGHVGDVVDVRFSLDGKTVISGGRDGVRRWNAVTGDPVGGLLATDKPVEALDLSPNGKMIASVDGNTLRRWDLTTGAAIGQPLTSREHALVRIAFTSDGKTIVTASRNGNLQRWDAATGALSGDALSDYFDSVGRIALVSDAETIAAAGLDQSIRVFPSSVGEWIRHACRLARRNLTRHEWDKYLGPHTRYERSCPDLPEGQGN